MQVSDYFRRKMNTTERDYLVKLVFTLANGTTVNMGNDNLMEGGLQLDSACSGSGSFDVGSVVVGQCKLQINNFNEEWNSTDFRGSSVDVYLGFNGDLDNKNEQIYHKKGTFYPDEIKYNNAILNIIAYNALIKADVNFDPDGLWTHWHAKIVVDKKARTTSSSSSTSSSDSSSTNSSNSSTSSTEYKREVDIYKAYPYEIIKSACDQCGIEYDEDELHFDLWGEAISLIDCKPEEDELTCREVFSYVAAICCRFVYIKSNGQIKFGKYRNDIVINETDLDGGNLKNYNSGDTANGGGFGSVVTTEEGTFYSSGDTYDGGSLIGNADVWHFGYNSSTSVGDEMTVKYLNVVTVDGNGYVFDSTSKNPFPYVPELDPTDFIIKIDKNPFVTDYNVRTLGTPFQGNTSDVGMANMKIRNFDIQTLSNPCVELGDLISFNDYLGRMVYGYVTEISFQTKGYMTLKCGTKGTLASESDTSRKSATTTPEEVTSIIAEETDITNEDGMLYDRYYMEDEYIQWATNVTDNPGLVYEEGGEYTQEYVDNYNKGLTYDRKTIDDKIDEVESYIEQYSGGVTSVNIVSVDQLPSPVAEKTLYLIRGEVIIA